MRLNERNDNPNKFIFLIFCMKPGLNKHIKVTEPFFEENSYYTQSWVNWSQNRHLNFYLNQFISLF